VARQSRHPPQPAPLLPQLALAGSPSSLRDLQRKNARFDELAEADGGKENATPLPNWVQLTCGKCGKKCKVERCARTDDPKSRSELTRGDFFGTGCENLCDWRVRRRLRPDVPANVRALAASLLPLGSSLRSVVSRPPPPLRLGARLPRRSVLGQIRARQKRRRRGSRGRECQHSFPPCRGLGARFSA
jgi:hypothetical protein